MYRHAKKGQMKGICVSINKNIYIACKNLGKCVFLPSPMKILCGPENKRYPMLADILKSLTEFKSPLVSRAGLMLSDVTKMIT